MWVWIVAAVGAVALVAGGVLLGMWLWRRQVRSYVIRLVAKREAVRAGYRSLADVVTHLAEAADEQLIEFAADPGHLDRRALVEVASRQRILREELEVVALPKMLWEPAEKLAAAAAAVERESGRVGESMTGDAALNALANVDLASARIAVEAGEAALHECCERWGVEDAAVYGGGLYI